MLEETVLRIRNEMAETGVEMTPAEVRETIILGLEKLRVELDLGPISDEELLALLYGLS